MIRRQSTRAILRFRLLLFFASVPAALHAAEQWQMPRTEYGHPDMQGVWYYGSATPMERPPELGEQQSYSPDEGDSMVASLSQAEQDLVQPLDPGREAPATGANIAQEADHNFATMRTNLVHLDGLFRTSQIISPSNGRFPFHGEYQDFFAEQLAAGHGAYDGPETRPVSERCVGPNGGPAAPMIGWFYNANMQIYQNRDYVVINSEMNHDARIIPLDAPLTEQPFPQWMGHSVGRWDGDTLVVETRNFRPEQSWFALRMSDQLSLTERFTLLDDDTIVYRFTMTDPVIYSEPVVVEKTISRRPAGEELFEYACHEGNYSLPSILAGARRQEADAAN